jgi:uncharacterized membrane protein (DUF373 family)
MVDTLLKQFEKYISFVLIIVAMVFVCFQVLDLVILFATHLASSTQHGSFMVEEKGRPAVAVFFGVLLTLEVIQTIKAFAHAHDVKVRIILIVGIIAVTRKILMLDIGDVNPTEEFAIAVLILSLSAGYFLVSRSEKLVESR